MLLLLVWLLVDIHLVNDVGFFSALCRRLALKCNEYTLVKSSLCFFFATQPVYTCYWLISSARRHLACFLQFSVLLWFECIAIILSFVQWTRNSLTCLVSLIFFFLFFFISAYCSTSEIFVFALFGVCACTGTHAHTIVCLFFSQINEHYFTYVAWIVRRNQKLTLAMSQVWIMFIWLS